ncbi:MAG: RagB/SusD family nutrient uptake outer membrane protein [Draconibacterium sp.]
MRIRKSYLFIILFSVLAGFTACDILDTKIDTQPTDKHITTNYSTLWNFGYSAYTYLDHGFNAIDNNLLAAISDEAEFTAPSSSTRLFNEGSWNAYYNPAGAYEDCYKGIRAANYFLENSEDYKTFLALNRDTISDSQRQYKLDVADIGWLRNENSVLRAYFYFELVKRYGGVPLVKTTLSANDNTDLPRASFDEVIEYIVSEIDAVANDLQADWGAYNVSQAGRFTKGAALAIKARALLYAASPLNNTANDNSKWEKAAKAAKDIIDLNSYYLDNDYQSLFLADNTAKSSETIWAIRLGATNALEYSNYPIGTPGGMSGITPSHNLVSAYEYKGTPDASDVYANRDPRLYYSVVTNNSEWNGRTIEIWEGGVDGREKANVSKTGYYLKKFLNGNLNLTQNEKKLRSWVNFRYAEILLNYAEAMNEAFGPDEDNDWGKTAREAINEVRARSGVEMPEVVAASQSEMREKIKHERRIELAFEDHRYWDLLRWKDAEDVLNQTLKGIKADNNGDGTYNYTEVNVEKRVFVAPKMHRFPIPQVEISKSNNVLDQNPDW